MTNMDYDKTDSISDDYIETWKPALNFIKDMRAAFVLYEVIYDEETHAAIDLRIVFANDFYALTIGYKPVEVAGKLYSEILSRDMKWIKIYADVAKEEKRVYVFEDYSKNVKMHLHTQVYSPHQGQVACMHFVRTDFIGNEQKAQKLAAIISNADAGVIVRDKEGIVIEFNVGAVNIFGYNSDEIIGNTSHIYTPEDNWIKIKEIDKRLKMGEHITHVEVVRKHKDGRLIDCAVSYTPLFDDESNFEGSISIFHDVTDKKQMEHIQKELLKEMEEYTHLMQVLMDTIPHPVFYKDAQTRFFGFNIAYCEVFGVKAEDLIGKTVLDLEYLPMEDRIAFQAEDQRIIDEGGHTSYEMPMVFSDGVMHETLYSVTGFRKADGSPGGLVGIFIDIADIRKAERALDAAKTKIEEHHKVILESLNYSSKIQKNLLPVPDKFAKAFTDYSVIWEPRDVVGGDIYWLKTYDEGTVLCVADCTGHGTPGALLTMLVASTLEAEVKPDNCRDTAEIIWQMEQRFVEVFNVKSDGDEGSRNDIRDGCDLAVLFIAKDGEVTLSSGHMNVFVCDGIEVNRIKGQKLYVGEGQIGKKSDIRTIHLPYHSNNKFYIASDGLFDQPGGMNSLPFGYKMFEKIILDNHNRPQQDIADEIWTAFETYQGEEPRVDDFELITFKP